VNAMFNSSMKTKPQTTVAIPLHKSAKWIDNVRANLEELHPVARIIVSDVTERDDTLRILESEFAGHPMISFLGRRDVPRGWVAHCNDLKKRAPTSFFMWLPHDDTVHSDWVIQGQEALKVNPKSTLAVGALRLTSAAGEEVLLPNADDGDPIRIQRLRKALFRQFVTRHPGFGHAFRGVQRQSSTTLLPEDTAFLVPDQSGWKADVFWALRQLDGGSFALMDTEFIKRVSSDGASHSWQLENVTPGFRQALLGSMPGLTELEKQELMMELWDAEAVALRRRLGERQRGHVTREPE